MPWRTTAESTIISIGWQWVLARRLLDRADEGPPVGRAELAQVALSAPAELDMSSSHVDLCGICLVEFGDDISQRPRASAAAVVLGLGHAGDELGCVGQDEVLKSVLINRT